MSQRSEETLIWCGRRMRALPLRIVTAVLVASLASPAMAAAEPRREGLENPAAAAHFDAASEAFDAEDYDQASAHLKAAYALEPDPKLLYAWGLAEESGGHYRAAMSLYEEFLEQAPNSAVAGKARANLLNCRARALELGEDPDARPGSETPPDDPVVDETPPAPTPEKERPARPLEGEWIAPTLLGVGAALAVAGGVVMGVGRARASDSANAPTEDAYFTELDGARPVYYGGVGTLAAGGLLVAGGAIRYIIVARRGAEPKTEASAVVSPHGFGLSFRGRF